MEKKKVISTCVPFAECERLLATAREKGKDAIAYKAMTRDRKPVSVTNIHGEGHGGEFSLVLTVEEPVEESAEKAEPAPESHGGETGGPSAGEVAEKLVDALGIATFAASYIDGCDAESYSANKISDIVVWLQRNGFGERMMDVISKAFGHYAATIETEENKE